FEHHIFNAGFGWRHRDISSVEVSIDNSAFHTGSRALRMVFKGPATSNAGLFVYVPVLPDTEYRLTGFVKAQDVLTASGPGLAIEDVYSPQILTTSEEFQVISGSRQVTTDFQT